MQKPSSNLNRKQPRRSHHTTHHKTTCKRYCSARHCPINLGQGKCASLHVRRWCKMQTSTGVWGDEIHTPVAGGRASIGGAEFARFLRMSNLCRCVLHHPFMHESSMILLFIHPPPIQWMQCNAQSWFCENKKKMFSMNFWSNSVILALCCSQTQIFTDIMSPSREP